MCVNLPGLYSFLWRMGYCAGIVVYMLYTCVVIHHS